MNQPITLEVIGSSTNGDIHRIYFEKNKSNGFYRAVMMNVERDFAVEICEAENSEDLLDHCAVNFLIAHSVSRRALKFYDTYNQRFIADDQWNEEQSKLAGTMNQFEAGTVIYSMISHAPYRVTHPSNPTDVRPGYIELVRQRIGVEDPDECLIDSESFDTLYDAIVAARNHIERDLFIVFAEGNISL